MAKILLLGSEAESLINFRGDLIHDLIKKDHQVICMAGSISEDLKLKIEDIGCKYYSYPIKRNSISLLSDLKTFYYLRKKFIEFKPDVVLAYTIKPIIWGGISLRTCSIKPIFYAMITGLGFAFQTSSLKQKFLRLIVIRLYKTSLKIARLVFFQNSDNMEEFIQSLIITNEKAVVVNGSGVNTIYYKLQPFPPGPPVFLTIARLLNEKGLRELKKAALIIKEDYPEVKICLLGQEDSSPDHIPIQEIKEWDKKNIIKYLGSSEDVRPYLSESHVFILPSYHEGMSRSILEAMSSGRPIITTDVPGCRETVFLTKKGQFQKEQGSTLMEGENGLIIQVKNAQALSEAIRWFYEKSDYCELMGLKSREIVENRFDVKEINKKILINMNLEE